MEGNGKADELAKEGASLGGGFLAEVRAKDVTQERREVYCGCWIRGFFTCQCGRVEPVLKKRKKMTIIKQRREVQEAVINTYPGDVGWVHMDAS